jgi:hypothetical protein
MTENENHNATNALEKLIKNYQTEHLFDIVTAVGCAGSSAISGVFMLRYINFHDDYSSQVALGRALVSGVLGLSRIVYDIVHGGDLYQNLDTYTKTIENKTKSEGRRIKDN